MHAMPLAWWLRPVTMHERLGEHNAVVCMLVKRTPVGGEPIEVRRLIGLP